MWLPWPCPGRADRLFFLVDGSEGASASSLPSQTVAARNAQPRRDRSREFRRTRHVRAAWSPRSRHPLAGPGRLKSGAGREDGWSSFWESGICRWTMDEADGFGGGTGGLLGFPTGCEFSTACDQVEGVAYLFWGADGVSHMNLLNVY